MLIWEQPSDGMHRCRHLGHTAQITESVDGRATFSIEPNGPVGQVDGVDRAKETCEAYLAKVPEPHVRVEVPVCMLPKHLRRGAVADESAIRSALLSGQTWPGCELVPIPVPT